jgi:4-amino-4-deoxy-L-arabinose transferase-like glycosyltransferase
MTSHADDRNFRRCSIGLALMACGIVFWGLGSIPLITLNEARRAVPITGMFQSGNWLLPYLNNELYVDKPPLFYWASLLFASLCNSVNEWVFRLPSALAAIGVMAASFAITRESLGKWHALFVALVLATCTNFVIFARRCEIEMLLTALCAGSLLLAYQFILLQKSRTTIYWSYALMGAALLCKGPVALLFVHLPILLMAWKIPRARTYLACWQGWLLMLVIGLSWYVAVTHELGIDVWKRAYQADIQQKIAGQSNRDPVYEYLLFILPDYLPWTLLLLATPAKTLRSWRSQPALQFFAYGAWVPLVVLSLFSNKHAKYLLPAYPAIAILVGYRIGEIFQTSSTRIQKMLLALSTLLLAGYLGFFAVFEKNVFSYRLSAMPAIAQLARDYPVAHLSSYQEVDMRTVYYYGQPIDILTPAEIITASSSVTPVLLLVEKDKWLATIEQRNWQEVTRLDPYIGKQQTAVVLGNTAFFKHYPKPSPPTQ